jgi:DnaB helicase-like protein
VQQTISKECEALQEAIFELRCVVAEDGKPEGSSAWQDQLLRRAIEWDAKNTGKYDALDLRRHFWDPLLSQCNANYDELADLLADERAKRQQHEYKQALIKGLMGAVDGLDSGDFQGVLDSLKATVKKAESVKTKQVTIPTVGDEIDAMWEDLRLTQGVEFTGMAQRVLPAIDDATDGFQGLITITATSGGGKTMFVMQNVLELLERYENACSIVVSMDMDKRRMMRRIPSNRAKISLKKLRKGSGPGGWTDGELVDVRKGMADTARLGRRIRILDRFNFPDVNLATLQAQGELFKEETGCDTVIYVFDYLQLIPTPDSVHAAQRDEYQMDIVRALADWNAPAPTFLISEANKVDGDVRGGKERIKGSARIINLSDLIITLNDITEQELVDNWNLVHGEPHRRALHSPWDASVTPAEARKKSQHARKIKQALSKKGEAPMMLKIDKARDGAEKTEIYLMSHFRENYFLPLEDLS